MPYNSIITRAELAGLIPTQEATAIIQSLPAASVALSSFRKVTMPTGVSELPVLSVLPLAYWVNGDTGLKQTSDINWENVTLNARELAVIIPVPQAVVDDASVDLWAEVRPRIAEAFGAKIDAAALFGTDSPTGWDDSIAEQAIAAGNEMTVGDSGGDISVDISDLWGLVEDDGFDVNIQWARRRMRSRLRGLRDENGQPIFQNGLDRTTPASIYGEDLLYASNGAWDNSYALIAGDRNAAIIGVRQDLTYRIFTEGVISDDAGNVVLNLMQQDAIALRAVMRVGFAVANPVNAIGAANPFPFAVLTEAGS
jgi:HK97 family phage major capsid protein